MKRKIHFFVFISLLSIFPLAGKALSQERNVKSSCRLFSTSGAEYSSEQRGKCTIKTYLDGDYLMVEVRTPWDNSATEGRNDLIRLKNNSSCTSWRDDSSDECYGAFRYSDDWGYVQVSESEENGRNKFIYSLGNAYIVTYDGPLPRP